MPNPNDENVHSDTDPLELPNVELPSEVALPDSQIERGLHTVAPPEHWPELHSISQSDVAGQPPALSDPTEMYWPQIELAVPAGSSATSDLDSGPTLDLSELPSISTDMPEHLVEPRVVTDTSEASGFSAVLSASHYGPTPASTTFTVPVPGHDELPDSWMHTEMAESGETDPHTALLQEIADGLKSLKPSAPSLPASTVPAGAIQLSTLYPRRYTR